MTSNDVYVLLANGLPEHLTGASALGRPFAGSMYELSGDSLFLCLTELVAKCLMT